MPAGQHMQRRGQLFALNARGSKPLPLSTPTLKTTLEKIATF